MVDVQVLVGLGQEPEIPKDFQKMSEDFTEFHRATKSIGWVFVLTKSSVTRGVFDTNAHAVESLLNDQPSSLVRIIIRTANQADS